LTVGRFGWVQPSGCRRKAFYDLAHRFYCFLALQQIAHFIKRLSATIPNAKCMILKSGIIFWFLAF